MKIRVLIVFLIIFLFLGLCSCEKRELRLNIEESFFSDFKVKDEKVLIHCTLLIENPTKTAIEVKFSANFEEDVNGGLLKKSELDGYQLDLKTKTFKIDKGDNWVDVFFIGEYAGKNQKHDRLLPNIQMKLVE